MYVGVTRRHTKHRPCCHDEETMAVAAYRAHSCTERVGWVHLCLYVCLSRPPQPFPLSDHHQHQHNNKRTSMDAVSVSGGLGRQLRSMSDMAAVQLP